jgi:hypothetical protein
LVELSESVARPAVDAALQQANVPGEVSSVSVLPALQLRLEWAVQVPTNSTLDPVQFHQVRSRRITDNIGGQTTEAEGVSKWHYFEAFKHITSRLNPHVTEDKTVSPSHFPFGADYEVSMRVATPWRWGTWSPPVPFSLKTHPPVPSGQLSV